MTTTAQPRAEARGHRHFVQRVRELVGRPLLVGLAFLGLTLTPCSRTGLAQTTQSTSSLIESANDAAARDDVAAALDAYDRALAQAEAEADALSAATAAANAALVDPARADDALRRVTGLSESRARGHLLLNVARAFADAGRAADAFAAARSALASGDGLIQSYAWGQMSDLYAAQAQPDDALAAARKAAFFAQQARSPDATFQFQWQLARLLRGRDDPAALDAYRRALVALSGIRHDIALSLGNRNPRRTFRTTVGPVFYETADLLLRRADALADERQVQQTLREARDTIEQLKSAELEDYFQDECVSLLKQKQRDIDVGLVNTAIVYMIPLPDRTELLVSTPGGMRRFTSPVTDAQIADEARQMRQYLEDALDHSYRPHARRLYDWLVRPLDPTLQSEAIDTLVFVPDGELRTISFAALMDGNAFLVDKYAVAVSPALSLTDPQPLARRRGKIELLAAGLSESRQDFPALPNVPAELDEINQLYGGEQLRDEQFQRQQFARKFQGDTFTIVHIASHGQFAAAADDTFLLTYDGRLKLDDLEKLIQPSQFRGEPVELLTLSACQTAAGDDGSRAALGLAGIAVKAGARSALATLWSVNDEASSELIGEFYRQLRENPNQTKAHALRAAQLKLRDGGYKHPYYWSPYLIIGNWM